MMTMLALRLCATAQSGLEINKVFGGKYSSDPTPPPQLPDEHQISPGSPTHTTSPLFKGGPKKYYPIFRPLLGADAALAPSPNARSGDAKLHYAFFVLPPIESNGKKLNRYIYYLNNAKAKKPSVMLIYFDGTIKNQDAEELIKSMAR